MKTEHPNHAKAIEAAARAQCLEGGFDPDEVMPNDGPRWRYYVEGCTAAITAFLRTVEPSPAMTSWGRNALEAGPMSLTEQLRCAFKAMSKTLADEVEQG